MRRMRSRIPDREESGQETAQWQLITPPALEPVTLSEVKLYHRISGTDEDDIIAALITAARQVVENHTGRGLIDQVWEGITRSWYDSLELLPNTHTITSVTYYDKDNVATVMDSDDYILTTYGVLPRLYVADEVTMPEMANRPDAIKVLLTLGYGVAASAVPRAIWQAIMLLVGHFYENRESSTPVNVRELPAFSGLSTVEALLLPYTVPVVR